MRMHRSSGLLALAIVAATPPMALAQTGLEIGPLVGLSAPVGTFNPSAAFSPTLPAKPSDLGGVTWGGIGRLWLTRRIGVQLDGGVTSSSVGSLEKVVIVSAGPPTQAALVPAPAPARVATYAAQLLVRPAPRAVPLWISAGVGIIHHGGDAYAGLHGLTSAAGAAGVGLDVSVKRWLMATIGVTTFLYSLDVQDSLGQHLERGLQVDVVPRIAVLWRWSRLHS